MKIICESFAEAVMSLMSFPAFVFSFFLFCRSNLFSSPPSNPRLAQQPREVFPTKQESLCQTTPIESDTEFCMQHL